MRKKKDEKAPVSGGGRVVGVVRFLFLKKIQFVSS